VEGRGLRIKLAVCIQPSCRVRIVPPHLFYGDAISSTVHFIHNTAVPCPAV
jgi:hypothetical protein